MSDLRQEERRASHIQVSTRLIPARLPCSFLAMSKAEILSELPRLSPDERAEILQSLWQLEEAA
jgi:hypothetical protein